MRPHHLLIVTLLLVGLFAFALLFLAKRDVEAARAELNRQTQIIEARSGVLEYARSGEGSPVLVIHGAGGGFDQGLLIAETFTGEGFQQIAPSRFGYLGSALPRDASTAAQADAFVDLLDALNIERASVLGFSGGAPPVLQLALRHPERVRCLVLMSPAPFTPHRPPSRARPMPDWAYQSLLGNDVIYWLMTKRARGMLEEAFDARADLRPTPRAGDEEIMIARLVDGFSPASRRVAGVANEASAIDPEARYEIERIGAPTLVIHARDDRLNQFAISEDLTRRISSARLVAFDTGGHLLLGHQAQVREEVTSFLTRCAAP